MAYHQITSEGTLHHCGAAAGGIESLADRSAPGPGPTGAPSRGKCAAMPRGTTVTTGLMGRLSGRPHGGRGRVGTGALASTTWPRWKLCFGNGGARSRSPVGCVSIGASGISHETIYRYVWQDKFEGGDLYLLPPGSIRSCVASAIEQLRPSWASSPASAMIEERPPAVQRTAAARGHLGDRYRARQGSTPDCIVSLVERETRLRGDRQAQGTHQVNRPGARTMR